MTKTRKAFLPLLTMALIFIVAITSTPQIKAATTVNSGSCGDNLTYTLDSDGTLTISGTGDMTYWRYSSDAPWYNNRRSIKAVKINSGVTSIGYRAFYDCTSLTSVSIPDSVTTIGSSAFYNTGYYNTDSNWVNGVLYIDNHLIKAKTYLLGIYSIKEGTKTISPYAFENCKDCLKIVIPDTVVSIGDYAFSGCSGLTGEMSIPSGVTSIGYRAFSGCTSLTSVSIPDSVISIGDMAFYNCTSLTSVSIPGSVTTISECVFGNCTNLTSVSIPDSVTSIGSNAFSRCDSLTSVSIPDSVTSIGEEAFSYCTSLTSVSIPDSVTTIGNYAFFYCSLTSVSIPDSVTSIGDDAFYKCPRLSSVYITDLTVWCGIAFGDSGANPLYNNASLYLNGTLVTDLVIPDGVKTVNAYAFNGCDSIKSVTFPAGIEVIPADSFTNCRNLEKVVIPSSTTQIASNAFPDGITVYGFLGSPAQLFAEVKGYDFVALDDVSYTVKYDLNGGEGSIPDGKKGHDAPYTLTDKKPVKNGFTFIGWSTAPDGDVEYTSYGSYTKNSDTIFYAVWKGPTVTVSDKTCAIGKSFDINVVLSDNSGLAGIGFDITYPDNIVLEKVTTGGALSTLEMTVSNDLTANPVTVNFDGIDADNTNGVVFTLTFKVKEDATEGVYDMKIDITDAHDNDMEAVDISDVNVKLTVKDCIPGDISGDGAVDLKDVTTIRRYLAGGYGVSVVDAALDVNGDGAVDLKDVTYLRRALAGGYGIELE